MKDKAASALKLSVGQTGGLMGALVQLQFRAPSQWGID
jgi:hypothetical protein